MKKKYGSDIPVDFLADKIEITDEEWHNAVEGYLNTQRMNIIVPPEYFMDAYRIYKKVRDEEKIFEYAIIDLQKVYEDAPKPMLNSLAEIVKSKDNYVQAYIDFCLGKSFAVKATIKSVISEHLSQRTVCGIIIMPLVRLIQKRMSSLTSEEIQSKSALPNASSSWKRSIQI